LYAVPLMRTDQVASEVTASVVTAPALVPAEPNTAWLFAVASASRPKSNEPLKLPELQPRTYCGVFDSRYSLHAKAPVILTQYFLLPVVFVVQKSNDLLRYFLHPLLLCNHRHCKTNVRCYNFLLTKAQRLVADSSDFSSTCVEV
jgi:hypothetical protein